MGLLAAMVVIVLFLGVLWLWGVRAMRQMDEPPARPRSFARSSPAKGERKEGEASDVE